MKFEEEKIENNKPVENKLKWKNVNEDENRDNGFGFVLEEKFKLLNYQDYIE